MTAWVHSCTQQCACGTETRGISLPLVASHHHSVHHITTRYITLPLGAPHYHSLHHITTRCITLPLSSGTLPLVASHYPSLHHITTRRITLPLGASHYHSLHHITTRCITLPSIAVVSLRCLWLQNIRTMRNARTKYITRNNGTRSTKIYVGTRYTQRKICAVSMYLECATPSLCLTRCTISARTRGQMAAW